MILQQAENRFDLRISQCLDQPGLSAAAAIRTFQVNVGLKCDLACSHCHVVASPRRTEAMDWQTMEQVLDAARRIRPQTVDITGGAPELNPNFRRFISSLRNDGIEVLVRTNLTVFYETGMDGIPEFYSEHGIHLVASLPCYLEDNVDAQRGDNVFKRSIAALGLLNALGYGIEPSLPLDLVYNPTGPYLPPDQQELESQYRQELFYRYGIRFTRLLTIANMPIGRYLADLRKADQADGYEQLLEGAFNPETIDGLMCRNQISIRWDGMLFDCDFNLAIKKPIGGGTPLHIKDVDLVTLAGRRIVTGDHCFGCTAGRGSSCGGSLVSVDVKNEGTSQTTGLLQQGE